MAPVKANTVRTTFLCIAVLVGVATNFGQPLELPVANIEGGGVTQTSGATLTLSVTVGQPDAAPVLLSGGSLSLAVGFWPTAQAGISLPPSCDADVNGDGLVDPLDAGFVLARIGCGVGMGDSDCDAADANMDGVVDPIDAGWVIARFGDC